MAWTHSDRIDNQCGDTFSFGESSAWTQETLKLDEMLNWFAFNYFEDFRRVAVVEVVGLSDSVSLNRAPGTILTKDMNNKEHN